MTEDEIREAIRRRYAAVATEPVGQFKYPVGRESAERLGYRVDYMDRVSPDVIRRFVGVGNPFSLGEPQPGWRVVDVGCGSGVDCQVAAHYVGPTGRVIGVDMSPEMLVVAKAGLGAGDLPNVTFVEGQAEALPVESGWADLVISNGVLNLAACKEPVYAEIARVLRPEGRFQAADLILIKDLPEDLRNDQFAWSG
jgi:SAM-dependent methyltransferase